MIKMIYTATSTKISGDQYDLIVTFDRDEAFAAAKSDWDHMSAYDRKHTINAVEGRLLEVKADQTAKDAYAEYLDESICTVDPVEYEEVR